MKTAILVDSACSLPKSLCDKYNLSYVPLTYSIDDDEFIDNSDEEEALAIFASGSLSKKHEVTTIPPSPEAFEKAIIKKIKEGYQRIVIQTVNRTQGETYENANSGVARVVKQLDGRKIILKVMDSRTVFSGQGLMATETVRRMLKSKNEDEVRREMDRLSEKIYTYILPKDPLVALVRSRLRNENNVGFTQALIAKALGIHPIICNANDSSKAVAKIWGFDKAVKALFDHAIAQIDVGLLSPIITVNYAGPIDELMQLPGYYDLVIKTKSSNVMLIPSVMSIAGGIYTSVGSISIALACPEHEWASKK
ncbi:MAG: DegV family protein with EDD domain [Flavobacteriales bacterium]|jgi:DegV family protein with EDD domain